MTTDRFDQTMAGLFASVGRPDASDLVADVVAATSQLEQRRALVGRFGGGAHVARVAWRSPALRLALAALVLGGLGVAMVVGSRPAEVPHPTPSLPVVPPGSALPSGAVGPTADAVPFVVGRRSDPAMARLADGRILVAGGATVVNGTPVTLATAEIVDLAAHRSTITGSLGVTREGADALTLADGRVLVVGGFLDTPTSQPRLGSGEIFDPVPGTFSPIQDMSHVRGTCHCGVRFHVLVQMRMTLLRTGTVFVAGGQPFEGDNGSFADLIDPTAGTTRRINVGCDTSRGTQTLLADGRVLVICFETKNGVDANRARIFDPTTSAVTSPAQPLTGSAGAATLLSDGRVLLTGAAADQLDPSAELFDVVGNAWTKVEGTTNPSGFSTAVALADGRIGFVDPAGGRSLVFDPGTDRFTPGVVTPSEVPVSPLDLRNGSFAVLGPNDTSVVTIPIGNSP